MLEHHDINYNMKNLFIKTLAILISFPLFSQQLQEVAHSKDIGLLNKFIEAQGFDYCEEGYNLVTALAAIGNYDLLEEAVEKGADLNKVCEGGHSALYYAALYDQVEIGKFLLANRADREYKDKYGYTAFDIAHSFNHIEFLQKVYIIEMDHYADIDGPYLFDQGDQFEMIQFQRNDQGILVDSQNIDKNQIYDIPLSCHDSDGNELFSFQLNQEKNKIRSTYNLPKKLVALSDIEGKYEAFISLLKVSGVINESLNWIFGKGHLVLVGDFFDRGEMVTETLWLIYKLEQEAAKQGGVLHFLLGNHEMMNLRGDWRYVPKKYLINAQIAGKSYQDFYAPNSVLGAWLRTKNTIVKIGSYVFCHGGLSPDFTVAQMPISLINESLRELIDKPDNEVPNVFNGEFLLRNYGPLWYRGHFQNAHTQEQLVDVLKVFNASYLVVGHTPVEKISTLYEGKIIALDVPHAKGPKHQALLMIEKNKLHVLKADGTTSELK